MSNRSFISDGGENYLIGLLASCLISSGRKAKVLLQKPQRWYNHITTEPVMFLYMLAFMVTNVIEQTFYVFRACTVNHGYNEHICYNISGYPEINKEVQVTVTWFLQWFSVSSQLVPCGLAFFLGSYSDKRGRKSIILAGMLGKLYFSAMTTLNTYKDWPVEYVIYTAVIPSALTGADLAIMAGCFAYVADVSSLKDRTFRIGLMDVAFLSAMPVGVALGNLLYNKVVNKSFTAMFAINTSLMVAATLHAMFFLDWQTRPEQKSLREAEVTNPLSDFFDFQHVKQTFTTLFKNRSYHRRLFLWFLLISMAFYTFQRNERSVSYLYTTTIFKWGPTEFSNLRTYSSVMYVTAMLFGIPLMTKVLQWRDTLILMIGAVSHISGHIIYALAQQGLLMYLGATAGALGPCIPPLIRSMTSKVLDPSEKGVAYTFLAVMETSVSMFSAVVYSQLYTATLETEYLNAFFYLTIGTQVVVFICSFCVEMMLKGRSLDSIAEEKSNLTQEK